MDETVAAVVVVLFGLTEIEIEAKTETETEIETETFKETEEETTIFEETVATDIGTVTDIETELENEV